MGCLDLHPERYRVCAHRPSVALRHGTDSWVKPFCAAAIWRRFQPGHDRCSYAVGLWRDVPFLFVSAPNAGKAHRSAASRRSFHHRVGRYAWSAVTGSRISLPYTLVQQSMIIYLAFCLIFATLVIQGSGPPCGYPDVGTVRGKTIAQRRTGSAADASSGCHRSFEPPARPA